MGQSCYIRDCPGILWDSWDLCSTDYQTLLGLPHHAQVYIPVLNADACKVVSTLSLLNITSQMA